MSAGPRLWLKVQSDPANLRSVRLGIERLCQSLGFQTRACEEIGLCVNEAIANIIRHAYHGAHDKPIEISAECCGKDADELCVLIRDWGDPVDPAQLARPKDYDPLEPGGLGLICIRRMMNDVQFLPQDRGTLLRMTRRLGRAPRAGGEDGQQRP